MEEATAQSDALHARAQAFIHASLKGATCEPFDALALSIARFQAARVPSIARLAAARGVTLDEAEEAAAIPAVPCDVFRLARVAAHPSSEDTRLFRTSGTSQGAAARGEHPLRTTATYELAALGWGRQMLWPDRERLRVLVLAPPPAEAPDSSLGFMLDLFASALGGRASFHVRGGVLDALGAARACAEARASGEATIVLGASFAFVHLLEATGGRGLALPPGSRAMQTGGFKGRSREVEPGELRRLIAGAFEVPETHVVGEYGMTELSSQAYEGTLAAAIDASDAGDSMDSARGAQRALDTQQARRFGEAAPGVYFAPPWVRVTAVDPISLRPVPEGEVGIARIIDLANIDSAVAVQTSDLVHAAGNGFRLLGRAPGALPRGCSLSIDDMLGTPRT